MNNLETLASQVQSAETEADGAEILREWVNRAMPKDFIGQTHNDSSIKARIDWFNSGVIQFKHNLIGEQDE